ncbi:carotenoid 1,2-hydratase [Fulvimarina endophytica]|uniref:Carotenoid 1,2-hydratase n=1 Tax=Fulvimarina endophytica TaxID=2293836 RepID=A0A371X6X0_9HYPH|nr:carotenoid 1,2-hydratase [Fulvimarina endophytica]RFC64963.1 carotenoid 1,2-hydratase [Fulvimarina endophytica]
MTERGSRDLSRSAGVLSVGPSAMEWDGDCLTVTIDEITPLIPRRVRGTVKLYPEALQHRPMPLDRAGRHCWWPIAPCARVEARFEDPGLAWNGHGYLDFNTGAEPLEDRFVSWNWSRACVPGGAAVLYDLIERDGETLTLAIKFDPKADVIDFEPPALKRLATSFWRMKRTTRTEDPDGTRVGKTLEDSPFYARSLVETTLFGTKTVAMHESLDLDRFRNPVVQTMLPYKMPRRFF